MNLAHHKFPPDYDPTEDLADFGAMLDNPPRGFAIVSAWLRVGSWFEQNTDHPRARDAAALLLRAHDSFPSGSDSDTREQLRRFVDGDLSADQLRRLIGNKAGEVSR